MPLWDLPVDKLETYLPDLAEPSDFDEFWAERLTEARAHDVIVSVEPVETGLARVETYDVTFRGYDGEHIKAWYQQPAGIEGEVPTVVGYIGYGGGRSMPVDHLTWVSAGYNHLIMDTRGQGSGWASGGATPDSHGGGPSAPGWMTRGIDDPRTSYLMRLSVDAARAIDAARALPGHDGRIALAGGSQGGGLSLIAAGLVPDVDAVLCDVPFLCQIRRAIDITDEFPYQEIVQYLATNRDRLPAVERTLGYVDAVHHARRATAALNMSVGLRDMVCPPSTVYAAYNHYAGASGASPDKSMAIHAWNKHEGGATAQLAAHVRWLTSRF